MANVHECTHILSFGVFLAVICSACESTSSESETVSPGSASENESTFSIQEDSNKEKNSKQPSPHDNSDDVGDDDGDDDDDDVSDDDDDDDVGDDDDDDDDVSDDDDDDDDVSDDDDDDDVSDDGRRKGFCFFESSGTYKNGMYEGYIDYVLAADNHLNDELCRVHFELKTITSSQQECEQPICYWATVVARSNPNVMVDVNETCANSDRNLGELQIAEMVNQPFDFAIGMEPTGHGELAFSFKESTESWEFLSFLSEPWDDEVGLVKFKNVDIFECFYEPF